MLGENVPTKLEPCLLGMVEREVIPEFANILEKVTSDS